MSERQKEIEEGKAIVGQMVHEIDATIHVSWSRAPAEQPTPDRTVLPDAWLLRLQNGAEGIELPFDSDTLRDLPEMEEWHLDLKVKIEREIARMGRLR